MAESREYDLIVVGAGMAGIILAARIAEMGINPRSGDRLRIALIEAGPHWEKEKMPGYGHPHWRRLVPQIVWEEFHGVPRWPWPYGMKMVGGCSLHWDANAFPPYDVDYKNWVDEMGIDWTQNNMKEAVDDVMTTLHVHEDPEQAYTIGNRLFRDAGYALGYHPRGYMTARKNCIYCGFIGSGHACKYDSKGNSLWYLPIFLENGGTLISDAEVKQVIIEKRGAGGVVKGIHYQKDNKMVEARANRVAVCCGVWASPVLLARSGYGPRSELGQRMIVENVNVGQNLDRDIRYGIPVIFDDPIKEAGRGRTGGSYWFDDDPDFSDGTGRVRFAEDMSKTIYPHVAAVSEFAPAYGKAHMDFMKTAITRLGAIDIGISKPPTHVRGSLDLQTGAQNYPGDPYIDQRMKQMREIAIELAKQMGCRISMRFPPRFTGRGGGHSNATCRAGSSPENSVINQDFESHEIEGLFIADSSSYPRAVSNNGGFIAATMGALAARRMVRNHFSRGV
jgi:choline dehydrogenase-like flavoprotein